MWQSLWPISETIELNSPSQSADQLTSCLSCHSVRRWPQLCSEQPESAGVGSAHELGYWNCERMVVDLEQMEKYRPVSPVASEMTGHHPFFLFLAI